MRGHIPYIAAALLLMPGVASANTIALGVLSFDNLIPDGATPGVNVFDIANFTGATWGLPPDFPVSDELSLLNATLTLEGDLGTQEVVLGEIDPGIFSPPMTAEFSDTINFTSATLTATLSESVINLYDSTTFTPYTETVTASIVPSSGNDLIAGTDFAVITVSDQAATPEPATGATLGGALLLVSAIARRKRARG